MTVCVGIVSDTHGVLPDRTLEVFSGDYTREQVIERRFVDAEYPAPSDPEKLDPAPRACKLIVHAGDICASLVIDELETVAPVVAVLGNCDRYRIFTARGEARDYEVFSEAGVTMAVVHKPEDLRAALYGAGSFRPAFITSNPRIAIHGHTHVPKIETREVTPIDKSAKALEGATPFTRLTLCPGSASRPREGDRKTVMVLYLDEGKIICVDLVALN